MKSGRESGVYEPSWIEAASGFLQLAASAPTPTRLSLSAFCS